MYVLDKLWRGTLSLNEQCIVHGSQYSDLRHYPAYKRGQLNVSELARVCNISRTTAYKYISLLGN